jgi:hypothetical protein
VIGCLGMSEKIVYVEIMHHSLPNFLCDMICDCGCPLHYSLCPQTTHPPFPCVHGNTTNKNSDALFPEKEFDFKSYTRTGATEEFIESQVSTYSEMKNDINSCETAHHKKEYS